MNTQNMKCKNSTCQKCTFVANSTAKKNRKGIFNAITSTNRRMKENDYPGACPSLVGSSKRAMIYIKSKNDNQYDHDIQNTYQSKKNPISNFTDTLREDYMDILKDELEKMWPDYTIKLEKSSRVITVKKSKNGVLEASFDIALIDAINNKIHSYKKDENEIVWEKQGKINEAYKTAKDLDKNEIKQEYLNLKHNQRDMSKEHKDYKASSSLFIEAVNNVKAHNET